MTEVTGPGLSVKTMVAFASLRSVPAWLKQAVAVLCACRRGSSLCRLHLWTGMLGAGALLLLLW